MGNGGHLRVVSWSQNTGDGAQPSFCCICASYLCSLDNTDIPDFSDAEAVSRNYFIEKDWPGKAGEWRSVLLYF